LLHAGYAVRQQGEAALLASVLPLVVDEAQAWARVQAPERLQEQALVPAQA
jgi:hypothetical protein